ncbi:MAG: hypothetical protein JWN56_412 [Sphingobacteriales bacterium]|nr:hypothetical protein [Sphingobacteriales bacterium]
MKTFNKKPGPKIVPRISVAVFELQNGHADTRKAKSKKKMVIKNFMVA